MTLSTQIKKRGDHSSEYGSPCAPTTGVRSGIWLVWLLLLSGLFATILAVRHTKATVDLAAEKEFESVCNEIRGKVYDRLSAHEQILRSGAAFFENSGNVSRQEWKSFTERQRVEQQHPGIQGIGFALLIPPERLSRHIQEIRAEGFPLYQVRPEGGREIYSSIIYLEPFTNRNLRAFGYDMLSEPVRRAAMEWSRDQDVAALSGKVTLVQETDKDVQAGTLMYVPVYHPGMPRETVAQRRAAIMGWVYSPYRMTDLMHGILGRWDLTHARRIRLEVFDGIQSSSETLLYDSQSTGEASISSVDGSTFKMPIRYADRSWTLVFSKSASSLTAAEYGGVWGTAFAGTVVGLLLAGLLLTLQSTRAKAERLARQLTKDLQATAHRLALAASAGGVGMWDYEVVSNELIWDDQMFALYGITRERFSGAYEAWTAGVHPDDRQRGNEEIKMALRGEKEFDTKFRVLWPDGTVRYIRALARVQRDAAGNPVRMVGTNWDITTRRRAEDAGRQARENFETLFNTITDFIFVLDEEGLILHANDTTVCRLGYSLTELQGLSVLLMHPAERRAEAEKIVQAMLAGDADFCPVPLISRSGELIPVETHVTPGRWDGKPVLFGVSIDITKRKQAEDALSLRESYLSAIIENQSGLIWLKDAESRFLAVNNAFAIACGKQQSSDLAGLTDLDIWPRELAEKYRKDDFAVMELRKPVIVEEQVYEKGLPKWFETYKTPVLDGQGVVIGTTGYARDITPRKKMEAALSRQKTLLSNLLDSIPDIVFFKDIEGAYLGCNPGFEELLDKPREKIIGHTDYDLFPKDMADTFRKNDRIMMAQNKARHNEEWITYPDGRRTLIDTLKAPLIASDGRVSGMLGVSRDITDRKQAEEALVQQSFLQKILMDIATTYINLPLEEVDHAIQTALKDLGDFVEADRAYIFDYNFDAGICTNTFEWCRDGVSPQIDVLQAVPLSELPDWVATHSRGDAVYYPDVAALPPGGVRDILEPQQIKSLLTIPLAHGNDCLGFVGFDSVRSHHAYSDKERTLLSLFAQMLTNIRLRRQNEAELVEATSRANDMADRAAAATMAKSMFLANMSHEIRTPLNAVLGYAQILNRDCTKCSVGSVAATAIAKGGEHLLQLINDILEIVRTDSGAVALKPVDFDFHDLLDDVRLMNSQYAGPQVKIEVAVDPGLPQFIFSDQVKIRQVLINLVGNAVAFTQRGSIRIAVTGKEDPAGSLLSMSVEVIDTGGGIAADQFESIFNPFGQVEQSQQKRRGTGLGLPLSRRYARALGGDVSLVHSKLGEGSTFRFTFTAQPSRNGLAESTKNIPPVRHLAAGQSARILAVDDDSENLQMLRFMLGEIGFVVEVVESGVDALKRCGGGKQFDLILMDKRMPGMDGLETIKQLRELPGGRNIPVVLVTASDLAEERLLDAGADGYLSKPLNREMLLREIKRLIGVQYEYDEKAMVAQKHNVAIGPDDLLQVPSAQRDALLHAIHSGSIRRMQDITADIARDHSDIAEVLSDLIGRYDYDELNRLLKQN